MTNINVLIIDDNIDFVKGISIVLREFVRVDKLVVVNNTTDALKELRTDTYSLCITELIQHQTVSVLDVIQIVEDEEINTYFVILTAIGTKSDAVRCIKLRNIVKDWFDKSSINLTYFVNSVEYLTNSGIVPYSRDRRYLETMK